MRDSMNAPLIYIAEHRGYQYEQKFILPSFFLSENEKSIISSLADQYCELGTFGYWKYWNQANILSKITTKDKQSKIMKEPFIAELQMIGERRSSMVLDYFLCETGEDNTCTYAFIDPDIFISVLVASNLEFKILSPKWLKEYMEERLKELLSML